jgi:hypothetical protein
MGGVNMWRVICGAVPLLCAATAMADVPAYCAAYARDKADIAVAAAGRNDAQWQISHDEAQAFCMARYTPAKPIVRVAKAPVPKASPVKAAAKVSPPAVKPLTKKPATEAKSVVVLPDLKPGSAEWIDYCRKKYVSFDAAKGTYTSLTGIERRCLVTAD